MEKGFGNETVQRMINILGTHGDYEKELVQIVGDNGGEGKSGGWSNIWNIGLIRSRTKPDKVSKAIRNGYMMAQKEDSAFLTEICTIVKEEPAYRQIVEEILQEAANSLGIKLKKLEKELQRLVGKEIARIKRKEIDEHIAAEKRDATRAANARLRSLIRAALDTEADHLTNR